MSEATYQKLLKQIKKAVPDAKAAASAEDIAEAGHKEGIELLKGWVRRVQTRFATVALSALMLAPKEALQDEDFVKDVQYKPFFITGVIQLSICALQPYSARVPVGLRLR